MQNAKKLRVYQVAEDLAVLVYALTREFPVEERFGVAQQMRRAAVSVGSNIAEGSGRDGNAELLRFLRIALGSATELEFQLGVVRRMHLASPAATALTLDSCLSAQRMLTRLIMKIRPTPETSRGRPKTDEP
ncbi:MAG: ribosomal protein [Gemmatimonadetes bacterium]|jgi:four helix bundle protein|nr:ribosomal protein [Gemmatimonadota bacterium]